jgi:hypothetical protein
MHRIASWYLGVKLLGIKCSRLESGDIYIIRDADNKGKIKIGRKPLPLSGCRMPCIVGLCINLESDYALSSPVS